MSNNSAKPQLISRIAISFDDETKASIATLQESLNKITWCMFGKKEPCSDGLLKAMQGESTTRKALGQWVFGGLPEHIISLGVNPNGTLIGANIPFEEWFGYDPVYGHQFTNQDYYELLGDGYDTSNCKNSGINRETVNDVDYLTDSDSEHDIAPPFEHELRGMAATLAVAKDMAMPSKDDLQLLFIKNLAELLIQRMHSLNRFSEDDYAVCGLQIEPWDIVVGQYMDEDWFAVVTGTLSAEDINCSHIDFVMLSSEDRFVKVATQGSAYFNRNDSFRTIRQDELQEFRGALEACYAK